MNAFHPYSTKFNKQEAGRVLRNARERARMNKISDAMDKLREHIPINAEVQKELSKFETLQFAINYIEALQNMLQTNKQPTPLQFAKTLANRILPTTPEILVEILQVQPHILNLHGQFEASSIPYTSSQNALHPHHSPQQHLIAYDPAPTLSSPSPQHSHTPDQPHSVFRKAVPQNERVRARTRDMNDALDTLREHIPIDTVDQKKLNKLETLRMAMNYIEALQKMLQTDKEPTRLEYANTLSNGMSTRTTEALTEMLQVQPHLLNRQEQFDVPSVSSTSFQNAQAPTSSRSAP